MTRQRRSIAGSNRARRLWLAARTAALVAGVGAALGSGMTTARAACLPSQCGDTSAAHGPQRAGDTSDNTVRVTLRDPGPGAASFETGIRAAAGCTALDLPQPLHHD
jgi:hypothetical protein